MCTQPADPPNVYTVMSCISEQELHSSLSIDFVDSQNIHRRVASAMIENDSLRSDL